ncbi:HAD-IA family hydrolase [Desulfosporosinus nitroreducens]|uniref:HAD-IA family hydrolase n=1 Tax=Desulfosporosinus nitroreducens TaxID=2018668 RepID=UPI00207CF2CE|nr:HAD-IA family hydrolase [Desulfosporosinus nitroreducens]MCO1603501.1 HAD-IA family hydrolase [Desulfosporosinus nitroreducens]
MKKNWVILDAMGVVFEEGDDTNNLLIPFILERNNQISVERVNELYIKSSLGLLSAVDFWNEVGLGGYLPKIESEYLDTYITLDPDFNEVAKELVQLYSLAILSNDVMEWSLYLRNRFKICDFFEYSVISGEVGFRKPDKGIYDCLLDTLGAKPSECVLVDDRIKNLQQASELGFNTILFNRSSTVDPGYQGLVVHGFKELAHKLDNLFK